MSWIVPIIAAGGLVLLWDGITLPRRERLTRLVEPYLGGLHNRPSGLIEGTWGPQRFLSLEAQLRRLLPYRYEDLRARLDSAGDARRPEEFRLEQLLCGLLGLIGGVVLFLFLAAAEVRVEPMALPVFLLLLFATGFLGRDWWLGRQMSRRHQAISAELPVALDLLALAIVAGESVPAAFERVAPRLGTSLGGEFDTVLGDIRTGTPVVEAMEALSRRVPDPGLARFVDAACTAIERGAPLSDVLRAQADDAREGRRRHLLELGGKREVLMLVPVVFLIMPVVVVFALYPGLVSLNLLVP